MPRDGSLPNRLTSPAPSPFVKAPAGILADRALRLAEVRREVAEALAQAGFAHTADEITAAASIVIEYPTAWQAYRGDPAPRALLSYKTAVAEAAEPIKAVRRPELLAGDKLNEANRRLDGAKASLASLIATPLSKERLSDLRWELRSAGEKVEEAMALREQAAAKRAEIGQ